MLSARISEIESPCLNPEVPLNEQQDAAEVYSVVPDVASPRIGGHIDQRDSEALFVAALNGA